MVEDQCSSVIIIQTKTNYLSVVCALGIHVSGYLVTTFKYLNHSYVHNFAYQRANTLNLGLGELNLGRHAKVP